MEIPNEELIKKEEENIDIIIKPTKIYNNAYFRSFKVFCVILSYYIFFNNFIPNGFYIDIHLDKNKKNDSKLKVALCTMGKYENLYANEFVEYYLNLGIDRIFIYDDNDVGTERISDAINIKFKDRVTIYENIKDRIKHQSDAFNNCYQNNLNKFDWFLMVDMDEYLFIKNNTMKNYLSEKIWEKCDFVKFNWVIAPDNNLVHYDPRPLFERFKPPYIKDIYVKTIVRGGIPDMIYWVHSPDISPTRNISCNNIGEIIASNKTNIEYLNNINVDKAFLIHFRFKSTEEFIQKYKRGYSNWFGNNLESFLKSNLYLYFTQNKITLEKIYYIEKELNISLFDYKIPSFIRFVSII